ncbi:MAG: Co/Zn/Cd efflux system component [Deltaproteobacteria bacterium]|nr:Co/Zn/Cd efflux system component [Deltaproteobacteria bacterium]
MPDADHHFQDHPGHNHGFQKGRKGLLIAIAVTGVIMVVEIIGGVLANSLALLSDAGHMLTDVSSLILSLIALQLTTRPSSATRTYGFYRMEILAALINGTTLSLISAWIFYEAYQRLKAPEAVDSMMMLGVAAVGLVANGIAAWAMLSSSKGNLNIRGAYLHILGDLLSSIGVLIGGLVIYFSGWNWIDPLLSAGICIVILRGAILLVKESVNILLEAVPKEIDLPEVQRTLRTLPGVKDMHHVHLWSISSGIYALSAHVLVDNLMMSETAKIIEEVNRLLLNKFKISHTTIQLECENCTDGFYCTMDRECVAIHPTKDP